MSRKPSRLLALVLLTALCCLLLAPCALAFERVDLTHPLTFAIQADDNEDDAHLPGVTFQLYQVADMDADARFALRSPYSTLTPVCTLFPARRLSSAAGRTASSPS